jgi:hypothetical protein
MGAAILHDAGPQEAGVAVGVVNDTAVRAEDHCRAVRRAIGGPIGDCEIARIAVAGNGDPGIENSSCELPGRRWLDPRPWGCRRRADPEKFSRQSGDQPVGGVAGGPDHLAAINC